MIDVMNSPPLDTEEMCLHPQLWHACAGGLAQVPPQNSEVYYFPQGHAEHVNGKVDWSGISRIPSLIPCRVSSIKYLADTETDEVYAKIRLVPFTGTEYDFQDDENGFLGFVRSEEKEEKTNSFAKTLTQSDANNGGGFSVPRYCAETIFPMLDYSSEPPVQTIVARDVHGETWRFRHIYRGTPRRHLLTTGWSNFVNQKRLVAGDSIVFVRLGNGDLCVGIRRVKRGISGGPEFSCGWNVGIPNSDSSFHKTFPSFVNENRGGHCQLKDKGNVRAESVVEAINHAARGRQFEIVYYPRAGTPEFVVSASAVRASLRNKWCSGMRFKMAFETEDSSRISWFMGTVSSTQVYDHIHWPNSPWRLVQVSWDEPDLLQNVKCVNPWLVEVVSNHPHNINLFPFSPPRKRSRLPLPSLSSNPLSPSSPLCCFSENIPAAGLQGARHAHPPPPPQLSLSSSPDTPFNKLQPFDFKLLDYTSCVKKKESDPRAPAFVLFGQPILTADQICRSTDTEGNSCSYGNLPHGGELAAGLYQYLISKHSWRLDKFV